MPTRAALVSLQLPYAGAAAAMPLPPASTPRAAAVCLIRAAAAQHAGPCGLQSTPSTRQGTARTQVGAQRVQLHVPRDDHTLLDRVVHVRLCMSPRQRRWRWFHE